MAHGWDSFLGCMDDTTKREMGTVDDILINYTNFVGDELRAFHLESARLMTRVNAIEDNMAQDHDAVAKLDDTLIFLKTMVIDCLRDGYYIGSKCGGYSGQHRFY